MIVKLNRMGKKTEAYYTLEDVSLMFFKRNDNKELGERIYKKMKKHLPWSFVTINGRQMVNEAEKNRIVAAYNEARDLVSQEMAKEREDYYEKLYPNVDRKFRGFCS